MKKISAHSKTSLFLMEMIFVLLFLALSSAACIRIFAAAKNNHIQAQEWRHIQTLTTSVGEILEDSDGTAKSFVSLFPDRQIQAHSFTLALTEAVSSCSTFPETTGSWN